jgi:hypothetical protein
LKAIGVMTLIGFGGYFGITGIFDMLRLRARLLVRFSNWSKATIRSAISERVLPRK